MLCAHRRGPQGVSVYNAMVEAWLNDADVIDPREAWYAGRPIGISRNDYAAGLYNGDVGLVERDPRDEDGAIHRIRDLGDDDDLLPSADTNCFACFY